MKKAAPRFELGIKDLQSSALPLGHAASEEIGLPSADRISQGTFVLLVVCNGHGEDLSGAILAKKLQSLGHNVKALPLVGLGDSYRNSGIDLICEGKEFSTGGIGYTSFAAQFWYSSN